MSEKLFNSMYAKQLNKVLEHNLLFNYLVKNTPPLPWRKRVINRIKWKIKSARVWLGEKIAGEKFN